MSEKTKTYTSLFRNKVQILFVIFSILMIILPAYTTFSELLTSLVENTGAYSLIQDHIVPLEARFTATLVSWFGVDVVATPKTLWLPDASGIGRSVYISWNCIGWQSFFLLLVSFATGLQGEFTRFSKWLVVLFGVIGTFWANLLRMALVVLIAKWYGSQPSIIFHDYGGNIMMILWLFVYWYMSYRFFLRSTKVSS